MICVLFNIKKCRMELLMLQNLWPTLYIQSYNIFRSERLDNQNLDNQSINGFAYKLVSWCRYILR